MNLTGNRLDEFYRLRSGYLNKATLVARQGSFVHQHLVGGVLAVPPCTVPVRRPSLCHDGTAVVYSVQLQKDSHEPAFRMLVEPGGLGIDVREQIKFARRQADGLLEYLGWSGISPELEAIYAKAFPAQNEALGQFWGGVWLGCAIGPRRLELRFYLNLRFGAAIARWQRVADMMTQFADTSLTEPFREWVTRVFPFGIPVGLGVVLAQGHVAGLRIYVGVHNPSIGNLRAMHADGLTDGGELLTELYGDFVNNFGPLPRQSATVSFDFRLDDTGRLEPRITRTKFDICCHLLQPDQKGAAWGLAERAVNTWGLDPGTLTKFRNDLNKIFGGADIEFISTGFCEGPSFLTIYARPYGLGS